MYKTFLGAIAAVIALSAGTADVFHADAGGVSTGRYTDSSVSAGVVENTDKDISAVDVDNTDEDISVSAGNYIDSDGDGICDNAGNGCGRNYADKGGDGICDNAGSGCTGNYADKDGDGICDNAGNGCGRGGVFRGRCGR